MISDYELFWASMGCNEQEYVEGMEEMLADMDREDSQEDRNYDVI